LLHELLDGAAELEEVAVAVERARVGVAETPDFELGGDLPVVARGADAIQDLGSQKAEGRRQKS